MEQNFLILIYSMYGNPESFSVEWFAPYRLAEAYRKRGISVFETADYQRRKGPFVDGYSAYLTALEQKEEKYLDELHFKKHGTNRQEDIRRHIKEREAYLESPEGQAELLATYGNDDEDSPGALGYVEPNGVKDMDELIDNNRREYRRPFYIPFLTRFIRRVGMLSLHPVNPNSGRLWRLLEGYALDYHLYLCKYEEMEKTYQWALKEREQRQRRLKERQAELAALGEKREMIAAARKAGQETILLA